MLTRFLSHLFSIFCCKVLSMNVWLIINSVDHLDSISMDENIARQPKPMPLLLYMLLMSICSQPQHHSQWRLRGIQWRLCLLQQQLPHQYRRSIEYTTSTTIIVMGRLFVSFISCLDLFSFHFTYIWSIPYMSTESALTLLLLSLSFPCCGIISTVALDFGIVHGRRWYNDITRPGTNLLHNFLRRCVSGVDSSR
jgi:hypothetical protein